MLNFFINIVNVLLSNVLFNNVIIVFKSNVIKMGVCFKLEVLILLFVGFLVVIFIYRFFFCFLFKKF